MAGESDVAKSARLCRPGEEMRIDGRAAGSRGDFAQPFRNARRESHRSSVVHEEAHPVGGAHKQTIEWPIPYPSAASFTSKHEQHRLGPISELIDCCARLPTCRASQCVRRHFHMMPETGTPGARRQSCARALRACCVMAFSQCLQAWTCTITPLLTPPARALV